MSKHSNKGCHPPRSAFDLGLAIGTATLHPGERRTHREIACYVNAAGAHCSWQNIWQIEQKALRKVRAAIYRDKPANVELRQHLYGTPK